MFKTRSDKYPLVVTSMLLVALMWFGVVLAWSVKILFSLNHNAVVEPVSSNLQQQAIQHALELFQQLQPE